MPWRGTLTSLTSSATSGAGVGFLKGVQLPGGPGGSRGVQGGPGGSRGLKSLHRGPKWGGGRTLGSPPDLHLHLHERKSPVLTDDAVAMVFLDISGFRSPEAMLLTVV